MAALRDKYNTAIQAAKGHMEGSADERDGKLHFHGTVKSEAEKNRIWDAIKAVPGWQSDVTADIKVSAPAGGGAASPQTGGGQQGRATSAAVATQTTYTVKSGDTLSKIAKELLGSANAYMEIFNANRDQLEDPDKIKPGQVLKIPSKH